MEGAVAGSTREYLIKSGYSTTIFNGDVVGFTDVANSTNDGYLIKEPVASEVNLIGVLGVSYTDPNTPQLLLTISRQCAASDIKAVVAVHPFASAGRWCSGTNQFRCDN